MPITRQVLLEGLGLCEHCGALLTIEGMPADAMDAEWRCPKCEGVLTEKTFGYGKVKDKWQKVYWVGKDGKFTKDKPSDDFTLGSWQVLIKPLRMFF